MMTAQTYRYLAYGLNIESTIQCPELAQGTNPPDVTLRYGPVPENLPYPEAKGVNFQAAPGSFLLSIPGIARYLVSDGELILISPEPGARPEAIRLFLLGRAFGALIHQRGLLPLHASTIEYDGACVAFIGPSGTGKSTLAAAFRKRGYRVMGDDICVVKVEGEDCPMAIPAFPLLSLWEDAVEELEEDRDSLLRVRPELKRYGRPLSAEFCTAPLPLRHVYILSNGNTAEFEVEPLNGRRKVPPIMKNTYGVRFLDGLGGKDRHLRHCTALARNATVAKVIRPQEPFLLDELTSLLEEDLAR